MLVPLNFVSKYWGITMKDSTSARMVLPSSATAAMMMPKGGVSALVLYHPWLETRIGKQLSQGPSGLWGPQCKTVLDHMRHV